MKPVLIATLLFAFTAPLKAETVTWRQGTANAFVDNYQGSYATLLASTSSVNNDNYGNLDFILVGRNEQRYSVIRFDLSEMAGNYSSINSASLTLYTSGNLTTQDFDILVYSLFDSNAGWDQMQATWVRQDKSGETFWKDASGEGVSNILGARDSLLQTIAYTTTSSSITIDIPVSMVLDWITSPDQSAGLFLLPQGSAGNNAYVANFGSNAHINAQVRPLLTVDYAPIPEVPTLALLISLAGFVVLHRTLLVKNSKSSD